MAPINFLFGCSLRKEATVDADAFPDIAFTRCDMRSISLASMKTIAVFLLIIIHLMTPSAQFFMPYGYGYGYGPYYGWPRYGPGYGYYGRSLLGGITGAVFGALRGAGRGFYYGSMYG
ncbi:hypothetical protein GCK32_017778 [Trichostrongylus colubriformis]|uniref:Uncharacterized protein n=1 Tax=Trichostrongylus colubriformis TaxID=6319 RepID=A0AAN8GAE2_TRICO